MLPVTLKLPIGSVGEKNNTLNYYKAPFVNMRGANTHTTKINNLSINMPGRHPPNGGCHTNGEAHTVGKQLGIYKVHTHTHKQLKSGILQLAEQTQTDTHMYWKCIGIYIFPQSLDILNGLKEEVIMASNVHQLKENWTDIETETGPHQCSSGPVYYN